MRELKRASRRSYDVVFVVFLLFVLAVSGLATGFQEDCCQVITVCVPAEECRKGLYLLFLLSLALLYFTYKRWRRAERERKEMEEVVWSINPDALMVVLPDSTIQDCTRPLTRMFGYDVQEVIGKKTWLLYSDRRSSPDNKNEIYLILERDGFHVGEATGIRKDGSRFPLEIITGNMGSRPGSVLLLRDISERKRVEQERAGMEPRLRQGHKMEAIGTLAGGIAHDFNNILAIVRSATELLLVRTEEGDASRSTLGQIQAAVERGASLVRQIMTFSGTGTLELLPVSVSSVVEEALEFMRASLPVTIEIRKQLEAEPDVIEEAVSLVFVLARLDMSSDDIT